MSNIGWAIGTTMLVIPIGCFIFFGARGFIGSKELLPLILTAGVSCLLGCLSFVIKHWKEE